MGQPELSGVATALGMTRTVPVRHTRLRALRRLRPRPGACRLGCALVLLPLAAPPTPASAQEIPPATATPRGPADPLCRDPEARAFDFWLGEWDVLNRNRAPDGERWAETGRATDRVYAVVGGCALVEHWRGFAFPGAGHIVGFSVRAWNPETRRWDLVLLWPVGRPPSFSQFHGTFRDGSGEFFSEVVSPQGDTLLSRLTFSDIGPDGFRWHNGVSGDGGRTWASTWVMEFTRRPAWATGLWNGPSMTTEQCPGDEHRAFDDALGEWRALRRTAGGDSMPVRVHLIRILEGCAVLERTAEEDGRWEALRVRAYEPASGRWVEYSIDTGRPALVRREGGPLDGGVVLIETAEDGGHRRTRWQTSEGAAWTRLEEEARAAGGPWSVVSETVLLERLGPAGR